MLGLLSQGPSYGYELKANFEQAVGPHWGDLNIGQLYQVLERLERDELVLGGTVVQTGKPDKIVYRITKQGREELEHWLASPTVRRPGYRDELFLKVFVAARSGSGTLRSLLATQRAACMAELAALTRVSNPDASPITDLLLKVASIHTEASLRVIEAAEERAPTLVAAIRAHASASPRPVPNQRSRRESSA